MFRIATIIAVVFPLLAGCTHAQRAAFETEFRAQQMQAISDPSFVDGISNTLAREIYRNHRRR